MMNYGLGDGAVLAGTKALSNAYLMGFLGDKNPGLGVMELGNFVLFGGSQAADCISPSKTITGAVNLAFDMMFKDPKEWQDRLKDGVYGPNMKNFAEGAGIMKDAMTNPQQFWKEWSEAVQSNPNGDMWKDMYNSSFELWNLPDNVNTDLSIWHPLDSIRTAGCALGKQATDGVIAIGEGAAKLGQKLGDIVGSNDTLNTLVDKAGDAAGYLADGAGKVAKTAVQGGTYVAKTAVNMAQNAASNAYNGLNHLTGGAVDSAVDMAGKAAGKIGDAASATAGAIKDGAGYVIDTANSAVDATVNTIGNAWDYMGTWFD
jgi:hypothetical protein